MNPTAKLYRLFLVEKQLRGLRSRLDSAERFLKQQQTLAADLKEQIETVGAQLKHHQAASLERENEAATFEEKIERLREQMNNAKTNREYKAFLSEVNTFKIEKDHAESEALDLIEKTDEVKAQLTGIESRCAERVKMVGVAKSQRKERAAEIKDRIAELEKDYAVCEADVPADALRDYKHLLQRRSDEDPMASVEVHDRKRHIYTCSACMIELPTETVSALLSHGGITHCVSCQLILYLDETAAEALAPASSKR